jgi:predicted nucleic acid-binding protein
MDGAALLDTNVYAALLRPTSPLNALYERHLVGRRLAVASQTVAEIRYGGLAAGWGSARLDAIERLVKRTLILAPDDETVWEYARLRAECMRSGHPLHQKHHNGDLWIAATARRWQLPLIAHDAMFRKAPGLTLITELAAG